MPVKTSFEQIVPFMMLSVLGVIWVKSVADP